jgi:3-oxoacyl-[acyl-carrier-protein] synthase-3
MGAIIESVAVCLPHAGCSEGSVDLAVRAADAALERAGCHPHNVGVLINTGVFRDRNIAEPAMAPFVQQRIGANPDPPTSLLAQARTLSFDLTNGLCGPLDACRTIDGLLGSGRARLGLLVTSDVDPTPGGSRGLAFDAAGAALLLRRGRDGEGFVAFHSRSFAKYAHLARAQLRWVGDDAALPGGAPPHVMVMDEDASLARESARCAARTIAELLEREALDPAEVDLVLAAPYPLGFPEALCEETGGSLARVVSAGPGLGRPYTAGIPAALQSAIQCGAWRSARRVLFVAASAGIGVATALYERAGTV